MSTSTVIAPVVAAAPVKFDVKTIDLAHKAPTLVSLGAGADSLKGRIGARTHAIHAVLACAESALTTRVITERATALMGRACNATASHLNTMKTRNFLVRENGAWALTQAGRELCGAPVVAPEVKKAPAKKNNKKKSK